MLFGSAASVIGCGPAPRTRSEEAQKKDAQNTGDSKAKAGAETKAEAAAASEGSASEQAPSGGMSSARKLQPWARKNEARLDEIAGAVGLDGAERRKIAEIWAKEREEILRLVITERGQDKPDWDNVSAQVEALRKSSDDDVKELLGAKRHASYLEHRPKVSTPGATTGAPVKKPGKTTETAPAKAPEGAAQPKPGQ